MLQAIVSLLLVVAQDAPANVPRDWLNTDPLVRFAPGSRMDTPRPRGAWTGRAYMTVTCVVRDSGEVDDCRIVGEEPARRINVRTALRAFRAVRLDLRDPAGPRPGDTVTTELVLSRARVPL